MNSQPARNAVIIETRGVGKRFASTTALAGVDMRVRAGEVTCVLGDNGAGKSTLIKILAGVHPHSFGELLIDGAAHQFTSPRQALLAGIATVYQDLAMVPLMPVWRNFFLGGELVGPFGLLKTRTMKHQTRVELQKMGIVLRDVDQPVGTLSGGERQSVAIARAVYRGARVLILDEPTAALGVKQSALVLANIAEAKARGVGVILITHNPQHAWQVGDSFLVLNRGANLGQYRREDITQDELTELMAGTPAV
ncbi:MAG: ATP-binding cassette domain-containing protein [Bowdeniella nasicola]|nr:ATP-binding cassette domain-containing protein [Bowdeniella nasicola]